MNKIKNRVDPTYTPHSGWYINDWHIVAFLTSPILRKIIKKRTDSKDDIWVLSWRMVFFIVRSIPFACLIIISFFFCTWERIPPPAKPLRSYLPGLYTSSPWNISRLNVTVFGNIQITYNLVFVMNRNAATFDQLLKSWSLKTKIDITGRRSWVWYL